MTEYIDLRDKTVFHKEHGEGIAHSIVLEDETVLVEFKTGEGTVRIPLSELKIDSV